MLIEIIIVMSFFVDLSMSLLGIFAHLLYKLNPTNVHFCTLKYMKQTIKFKRIIIH